MAASGPSLSEEVGAQCAGHHTIAVNDAWRRVPGAAALYACDASWWNYHKGCDGFAGEKWSSQGSEFYNDKRQAAERWDLNLVRGVAGIGFSLNPSRIHYGDNSGFQAINLAIHFLGARGRIALVGFDMRIVEGKRHFFGEHPPELRSTTGGYAAWPKRFERANALLPPGLEIVNCTPGSALRCFKKMDLADASPAAA